MSTPAESTKREIVIERIVYQNPENGWTVARIRHDEGGVQATAVGTLYGVGPGERLEVTGRWEKDRKYGMQLRIDSFSSVQPTSLAGIQRYLGSGSLPGVGEVIAGRMVKQFGADSLRILDEEPERLLEVPGIGRATLRKITSAWQGQKAVQEVMIFLQGHGVSLGFSQRIARRYGSSAVAIVRRNPFRLAEEIPGFGFAAAEKVATSLGWGHDAPERVGAGTIFALRRATGEGHLYLPFSVLRERAAELLQVDAEVVEAQINHQAERRALVIDGDSASDPPIYPTEMFAAERGVAARLLTLCDGPPADLPIDATRAIEWYERRAGIELADEQRLAVTRALTERVLIITGGPGTGKTTLVHAVVEILLRKNQNVLLAAPTGRAANRLGEATGVEVKTIHRMLEFDPHSRRFRRNEGHPLEADLAVVDEASMVDIALADSLLRAIPPSCRLLWVGDVDQLPSVGPGKVLSDLIASERLPVVRLQEIFRQHRSSRIVVNAHRIQRGEPLDVDNNERDDFFLIRRRDPEQILQTVLDLVSQRIPDGFALPARDIQVLAPMRRGVLGTENLNRELQGLLNTREDSGGDGLRLGDRVMQTRNNYDLEVFNGDIGFVVERTLKPARAVVAFEQRKVLYEDSDLDDLTLAYACTVHKAQGSEYPCVVLPIHTQHFIMLQRNLFYTAVTRASRLLVVVGEERAVEMALANRRQQRRYTRLADRLRGS